MSLNVIPKKPTANSQQPIANSYLSIIYTLSFLRCIL